MSKNTKQQRAIIYIRKSTNKGEEQKYSIQFQKKGCVEYCKNNNLKVIKIVEEKKSGKNIKQRKKLLWILENTMKFDVLVVYKIDRLGRNAKDILNITREKLQEKKVVFLKDNIDTSTPQGRLFLTQLSGFAEFEREIIVGRIKDGLAEAVRQGKKLGRPIRKQNQLEKTIQEIRKMRKGRHSWKKISESLGYKGSSGVFYIFKKYHQIYKE